MSDYYWDDQIEYLRNTRWLYYNDDYLELKLLPLLPEGSTYTGLDKGKELIKQANDRADHHSSEDDRKSSR